MLYAFVRSSLLKRPNGGEKPGRDPGDGFAGGKVGGRGGEGVRDRAALGSVNCELGKESVIL
jgi:hypothetical protein